MIEQLSLIMYVQTNKSAIIYYMSSESVPVLSCKENVNKCNFGVLELMYYLEISAIYLRFSVKGFDCLTFIVMLLYEILYF